VTFLRRDLELHQGTLGEGSGPGLARRRAQARLRNRFPGALQVFLAATVVLSVFSLLLPRAAAAQSSSGEQKVSVFYAEGRAPEQIPAFRLYEESSELYVTDFDVARIFHGTRYWDSSLRQLAFRVGDQRFEVTVGSRLVRAGDTTLLLRVPVLYREGSVMLPMEFLTEAVSGRVPERVAWDATQRRLTLGIAGYNVSSMSFEADAEATRVTIELEEPLLHHVNAETPGLLRLKLYGARLHPRFFSETETKGLVRDVRAEQTARDAFLYFDLNLSTSRYKVETSEDGRELQLVLEKEELPDIPEPDYVGKKMLEIRDDAGVGRRFLAVRTVVIDPGHGGPDKGRVGPSGALEKDVNLEIAKRLKEELEDELDVRVVLTREEDVLVPLYRRSEIANQEGADLFISVHCNGWFGGTAGGVETFFLSPAKTEWDAGVARTENASMGFEESRVSMEAFDDLNFILWDLAQNEYINESSSLAEMVQRELASRLDIRNRGVKQAGFYVLKGARMPAILIETAFLSNPREESLLTSGRFQRRVVEGIAAAVLAFKNRYELSLGRRE
jgi:N-acetylmuramoyl-L-alanine amidase